MFDYSKWLNPKIKTQSGKVAISAISAIQNIENSRNSRNSNSSLEDFKNLDLDKLKSFLGEDWELCRGNNEVLLCWADLLHERQLMEQGVVPEDFTAIVYCVCCGDVFVPPAQTNNGSVDGCPWCLNKARGLPVPNAEPMRGEIIINEIGC